MSDRSASARVVRRRALWCAPCGVEFTQPTNEAPRPCPLCGDRAEVLGSFSMPVVQS